MNKPICSVLPIAFVLACGNEPVGPAPIVIGVTVSPASASIPAGSSQDFTATVTNDPNDRGVTWAIIGCSGGPPGACGTLTQVTSTTTTYTAFAPVHENRPAEVIATSVSDTTKSITASVVTTPRYLGYTAIDLGTLSGNSSKAYGINAAGQVVGWSSAEDGGVHAFLWENGVMNDLGTLAGILSIATSINDLGQVVGYGYAGPEDDQYHAFLWTDGHMSDLGTLGGRASAAQGINSKGQVVGWSETTDGENSAFLWEEGTMAALGPFNARAINSMGQIVGNRETPDGFPQAVLWQDGQMTDLGTLGGRSSTAFSINAVGQVVGSSETAQEEQHGFLWEHGVMTDLGAFEAYGINPAGDEVVGVFWPLGGAVLGGKGIRPELSILGLGTAYAINPTGQIVGVNSIDHVHERAVLWTKD